MPRKEREGIPDEALAVTRETPSAKPISSETTAIERGSIMDTIRVAKKPNFSHRGSTAFLEILVLLVLGLLFVFIASFIDASLETAVGVVFVAVATAYFSYRRWKEAKVEVAQRLKAEADLQRLHSALEGLVQERTQALAASNKELAQAYDATIEGWSHALDLRDKETEGHSQRVTHMTLQLARAMDISETELVHVRRGALLHDIGKLGVPDGILLKSAPLTDEEWILMKEHPTFAYQMLHSINYLGQALDIPYCHHEKWDGTGYPRGLAGPQIPLAARIFAIVDVWDALRSDRPYRPAWLADKVRNHIEALSGTHFDPAVVKVFLEIFRLS
jgi:putative nucleotidyltransferase with HDIG domain